MNKDFSYLLSKYLNVYLILELNVSIHTKRSYTNTFKLLIDYLVNIKKFNIKYINFNLITRNIIIDFLDYLEEKGNSISTRNQRLSAIKSFYNYCLTSNVDNIYNAKQILSIKSKKVIKKEVNYLTEEELQLILNSIDTTTNIGKRNYLIITILYDTACRSDELRHIKVEDIHLENKTILINGKGNKQRYVPIMGETVKLISDYMQYSNIKSGYLFAKKLTNSRTSFLAHIINNVTKNLNLKKKITPHTFRHTRAIHLLDAGVPLIYIRDLLGHSSITTTERYARVSNKFKKAALEKANKSFEQSNLPDWTQDKDLLNQLINL